MEESQFMLMAKGKTVDIKMSVTARSTGSCTASKVTETKNDIFDMLRGMAFDVDKIEIYDSEPNQENVK